jgi:hypothetical protein
MTKYPDHHAHVIFTDLQGVERKGIYNAEKHGFQETADLEVPLDSEFFIPEDEVTHWQPEEDKE